MLYSIFSPVVSTPESVNMVLWTPTPEYGPPAQIAADADERIRTCILKGSLEPFCCTELSEKNMKR